MRIRTASKWLSLVLLARAGSQAWAAPAGGITVTPAALTLALPVAAQTTSEQFAVTNNYAVPVTVHFALQSSPNNVTSGVDASRQLSVANADLALTPGKTATQTVVLHDDSRLAPGSQQANLLVSQTVAPGGNVGVVGSFALPIVTIKEAGATQQLGRGNVTTSHLMWRLPATVGVSVRNTGNTIVIPYGYVAVTTPNGNTVKSGVMNVAAAAITPGESTTMQVSLASVRHALWPGVYQATFSYGLGGGQTSGVVRARFLYIAWWHVLVLAALIVAAWCIARFLPRKIEQALRQRQHAHKLKPHTARKGGV